MLFSDSPYNDFWFYLIYRMILHKVIASKIWTSIALPGFLFGLNLAMLEFKNRVDSISYKNSVCISDKQEIFSILVHFKILHRNYIKHVIQLPEPILFSCLIWLPEMWLNKSQDSTRCSGSGILLSSCTWRQKQVEFYEFKANQGYIVRHTSQQIKH